jgi:hypothetical protein
LLVLALGAVTPLRSASITLIWAMTVTGALAITITAGVPAMIVAAIVLLELTGLAGLERVKAIGAGAERCWERRGGHESPSPGFRPDGGRR